MHVHHYTLLIDISQNKTDCDFSYLPEENRSVTRTFKIGLWLFTESISHRSNQPVETVCAKAISAAKIFKRLRLLSLCNINEWCSSKERRLCFILFFVVLHLCVSIRSSNRAVHLRCGSNRAAVLQTVRIVYTFSISLAQQITMHRYKNVDVFIVYRAALIFNSFIL